MNIPLRANIFAGPPASPGYGVLSSGRCLTVQIGSVSCAISCSDSRIYDRLKRIYAEFLTERAAEITIELARAESSGSEKPAGDGQAPGHRHDVLPSQASRGEVAQEIGRPRLLSVGLEWSPADSDLQFKYMNQLLVLAYYTACHHKYNGRPPAMLVHACGILRRGRVAVFAGPCESGKTTIARLCGERNGEIINDEMLLISRLDADGYGMTVQGTPIIGGFIPRMNIKAPLGCIFLLRKGDKTLVRPLERVDSYLRFLRQIITPSYIGEADTRTVLSFMADFTGEVTEAAPVYELEFNMEREPLWRVITEFEGTPV